MKASLVLLGKFIFLTRSGNALTLVRRLLSSMITSAMAARNQWLKVNA